MFSALRRGPAGGITTLPAPDTSWMSRLSPPRPGSNAGPELPPCNATARESSRSPLICWAALWHHWQRPSIGAMSRGKSISAFSGAGACCAAAQSGPSIAIQISIVNNRLTGHFSASILSIFCSSRTLASRPDCGLDVLATHHLETWKRLTRLGDRDMVSLQVSRSVCA